MFISFSVFLKKKLFRRKKQHNLIIHENDFEKKKMNDIDFFLENIFSFRQNAKFSFFQGKTQDSKFLKNFFGQISPTFVKNMNYNYLQERIGRQIINNFIFLSSMRSGFL